MIPISLNIKGLYSYREETFIDFTSLTAAGLFGIFGAVGSGKSTILEAISFALYGETERLNKSDKRSYNMMNLRSKQLFIDFIFTCGDCDLKYKFTVSAKRNSKNFNDGGKIERLAYIWENNWIPTDLDAEQILGLSYDNFKRTIIIPQGKFQEFLQLKESDRVQMLKEIFSLEKFELSPRVTKLVKENDIKVSYTEGQMQSLPEYDKELLKEKEKEIQVFSKEIEEYAKELQIKQEIEKGLQLLKSLHQDIKVKIEHFNSLKNKEPEINELEKKVAQFEKCEQVFRYPLEARATLATTIETKEADVKKLVAEKGRIEHVINIEKGKIEAVRESYETRETLLQKAIELEKIIVIKDLQSQIEELSKRIENGEKLINVDELKLHELKAKTAAIQLNIEKAEQELPDTLQLIAVNNWFNNKRQLEENNNKNQQEAEKLGQKLQLYKQRIQQKLHEFPAELFFENFPESIEIVKAQTERLFTDFDRLAIQNSNELAHLKLTEKLGEFAKALQGDEECPLCGSKHHPNIFSAENVSDEIQKKQILIDDLQKKKNNGQSVIVTLSGAYADYANLQKQHNQKQQECKDTENDIEIMIDSFQFTGYTIEDQVLVQSQLANIEKRTNEIKQLRKDASSILAETEKLQQNILKYKAGVESFRNQNAQKTGEREALSGQILLQDLSTELRKKQPDFSIEINALRSQYKQLTNDYEKAQKTLQEGTYLLAGLEGRIEEFQKQLNDNIHQKSELNNQIQILLIQEGYQLEKEVEAILTDRIDLKKEKGKIETFRREIHAVTIQLAEAKAKVDSKEYDEQKHEFLKQDIARQLSEITDKTEKLVTKRNGLLQLKQQMESKRQLQKELDKLMLRAENLKVLSNLFRSSGFVNYVSSVYLQNLINSANQRFYKMTRQKLMLELAEDNAFRVRDFMNNGEVRSIKTLSGGQTFQAALSLALALADNIQHLTKSKQNFFFLDEGFGSLDKDALATVFETLKGLRKENRIVGVISHVDEMQQEIPVNLKIINEIEKGSYVTKSWN